MKRDDLHTEVTQRILAELEAGAAPWVQPWSTTPGSLKAAVASARILHHGEDEAMLRDVFYLRHGNDDPGPAGRILVAWRALDHSTTLDADAALNADAVGHVADLLGLKMDDELRAAINSAQQICAALSAPDHADKQWARQLVHVGF